MGEVPIVFDRNQLKNEYGTTWLAYYEMNKPSSLPSSVLKLQDELPIVCLDLVQPLDLARLSQMQEINHKNIMRIEALEEIEIDVPNVKVLALFIDQHNGPLGVYLDSLQLYDKYGVVPSQSLRDIIRQILSGLEELRKNGFYHGDLSMNNIFVSRRAQVLIKLFNFRTRDDPKEETQLADCVGVGFLLEQISNELKLVMPHLVYTLIDKLASTLMGLTDIASLQTVEEMTRTQLFFWDPRRRKVFWIHDVPKALENADCNRRIKDHDWTLP